MKAAAKVAVDTVACLGVSVHWFLTQIGRRKNLFLLFLSSPDFEQFTLILDSVFDLDISDLAHDYFVLFF